ncbi:MAG: response regulator [Verrucomicrobiales bacterium]|nr:response regulator [Verrucomicrobiales bacterium]
MADISPEVAEAYARHEREIGLQRLRLGCWIAMALTPPGVVIDLLYYLPKVGSQVYGFMLMRLACSAAVLPILELSNRPFGARHFRFLGVLLAVAPAFCMAWIIHQTDGAESPYYAGLNLVLLGVGMVMQWSVVQSLSAALIVFMLYLGAVLPLQPSLGVKRDEISHPAAFVTQLRTPSNQLYQHLASHLSPALQAEVLSGKPEELVGRKSFMADLERDLDVVVRRSGVLPTERFTELRVPEALRQRILIAQAAGASLPEREVVLINRSILAHLTREFEGLDAKVVKGGTWGIFLNNIWFMLLTAIIVVIGNHVGAQLRFSDYVGRFNLDRSRRELEVSNSRLGQSNLQLEETNKRLRELDELKGRFFANISHELRTPLTLLLGPIENLAKHQAISGDERLRENVGTMQDNGLRLLKLINDLLDLVRLDAGQLPLHKVRVDVPSFTGILMNSVRRFAEDRGLRVACVVEPGVPALIADPDKLEKVLLNLLFNSIKFTPAGGEVRLTAFADRGDVIFEVSDTGMGIAPEHLSQLFQRFWQADSSAHRKYQGAGIGLALVKELVEAHQGQVVARSEVGKGTTMTVRLPQGQESELASASPLTAPGATDGGAASGTAAGGGAAGTPGVEEATVEPAGMAYETRKHLAQLYKRAELQASITPLRSSLRPWDPGRGGTRPEVLVVDDEPDMLRFLRSQLEDDYQVREAVDGDQATVMASQYLPDAVVCDMMLPEKDGLQVCREIRANHTTRSLPFLMLTARADDETKLAALSAGASDFLPKPFSTAELKLRLKNLVDAQRLQKELTRQNRKLESTLEELRETESQLVQAEKMASLGRLSAGIIHEINNPLNFARTGLHVLKRHGRQLPPELNEEFDEVLRDISEGITRVSTIVGDLRQFSHPQADAVSEVDVCVAVEAAMRFLAADWKDGRADLINDVPVAFTVYANRNKLVQILLNLCQNSFDAMRDKPPADGQKPCLRLRAWRADGRRYVSVRDNGPGIPSNHVEHIFEPFYTTKEVGKGMGLGLSICYRIMEEVGGRIAVETEVGRFCEFILDFPDRLEEKTFPIESKKSPA